jgi:ABC-2 type transport system permease protein
VASVEARKRMSYRADFWLTSLVGFLAELGVAWFIVAALYRDSGQAEIGGYARAEMLFYYVAVIVAGKIVRAAEMEQPAATEIYDGSLSRFLLYPASYLGLKLAQQAGALVPAVLQALLFAAWAPFAIGLPAGVSAGSVAMALGALAVANVLHFLAIWPLQLVAFWADNVWSLIVGHRFVAGLLGGVLLPLSLFPDRFQPALDWLPFRYMFAFPVETLLGLVSPRAWLGGVALALAWCLALAAVGRWVWRRGTRQYTGVGI